MKPGATLEVAFNMNKAHFFEAEIEDTIIRKTTEEMAEESI